LDGAAHTHRKQMFLSLMSSEQFAQAFVQEVRRFYQ
jgi:hypothetical protein